MHLYKNLDVYIIVCF